jgi:hypothetical protein
MYHIVHQHFRWHTSLNHSPCFEIFSLAIGMRYVILLLSIYDDSYVMQVERFFIHSVILFLVQNTLFCYLATKFMDLLVRTKPNEPELLLTHKSITESKPDPELRDNFTRWILTKLLSLQKTFSGCSLKKPSNLKVFWFYVLVGSNGTHKPMSYS